MKRNKICPILRALELPILSWPHFWTIIIITRYNMIGGGSAASQLLLTASADPHSHKLHYSVLLQFMHTMYALHQPSFTQIAFSFSIELLHCDALLYALRWPSFTQIALHSLQCATICIALTLIHPNCISLSIAIALCYYMHCTDPHSHKLHLALALHYSTAYALSWPSFTQIALHSGTC